MILIKIFWELFYFRRYRRTLFYFGSRSAPPMANTYPNRTVPELKSVQSRDNSVQDNSVQRQFSPRRFSPVTTQSGTIQSRVTRFVHIPGQLSRIVYNTKL